MVATTVIHEARLLPTGRRVLDQADAARSAGMSFAWCARAWGKRELALWLVGPYTRAVAAAREPMRRRRLAEGESLDPGDVRTVLTRAHAEVTAALRGSCIWRPGVGISAHFVARGFVVPVVDDLGAPGFAPASRPGM